MKYYLSLCCIIKNEKYLEEFIMYHHIQGVEHFYIYDNESSPSIKNRLNSFYFKKLCTIIDFPGKYQQMPAYKHFLNNFKNDTKWVCIIDGDEYILGKKHNSIRDIVMQYENYHCIAINWVMFGSSFYENIQDGFLTDMYRYCSNTQDKHIKNLIQTQYIEDIINPHYITMKDKSKYVNLNCNIIEGPFNYEETTHIAQINHYLMQSTEDRLIKYNRGNADSDLRIFLHEEHHELYNDIIDNYLPEKYLENIKKLKKMSATNHQIYQALNPDVILDHPDKYYDHIFNNSMNENRYCHITDKYPDFNRNYYRKNYKDLQHLNDLQIELHYINSGYKEGRVCDKIIEDNDNNNKKEPEKKKLNDFISLINNINKNKPSDNNVNYDDILNNIVDENYN